MGEYTLRYDHWCANQLDKICLGVSVMRLILTLPKEKKSVKAGLMKYGRKAVQCLIWTKHLLWWGGEDVYIVYLCDVF